MKTLTHEKERVQFFFLIKKLHFKHGFFSSLEARLLDDHYSLGAVLINSLCRSNSVSHILEDLPTVLCNRQKKNSLLMSFGKILITYGILVL